MEATLHKLVLVLLGCFCGCGTDGDSASRANTVKQSDASKFGVTPAEHVAPAASVSQFTLSDLIAIEKIEHGTDAERLSELDNALQKLPNCRFTPTPDEFRIVAEGLRHKDEKIQAASAALLEKLSSQSTKIVAENLVRERNRQFGSEIGDEVWFRSVYYLGFRSEIPGADAFQAFHMHFKPHRICGDRYRGYRPEFELSSHLNTRDLATLNYAMGRQIEMLENPSNQEFNESIMDRIANIAEHCPDPTTSELAKKLYDLIGQQNDAK